MKDLKIKLQKVLSGSGVLVALVFAQFSASEALAGFFTIPHFVSQGQFSAGAEPEGIFTQGGSFGVNLRYTHGFSESSNLVGILGAGSGFKGFRMGAAMTFDVFPDTGKQPGVGFGVQGLLVQRVPILTLEATGFAYIHKKFEMKSDFVKSVEPFLAVPFGLDLGGGSYQVISSVAMGSMFPHSEHFTSVLELNVGLSGMDTSISGGIAYYP